MVKIRRNTRFTDNSSYISDRLPFNRKFLHYSPDTQTLVGEISSRAVAGCWFELHRKGGCGAGEIVLNDEFVDRAAVDIGNWIAFEYDSGDR